MNALRQCLLLLALPLVAFAADAGSPSPEEEQVFDRAVAAIDGKVMTLSQLELEARVLLVNAGGVEAAFAPLPADTLKASLDAVIDERLAVFEADKLDAFALEPGELEKALDAFRARFVPEARYREFLAAHEASDVELGQVLRRHLRAQRVLESKFRLRAQVSEAEARRLLANRPDLKNITFEQARQRLFAERFRGLVQAELRQARKTIDVRLLGPWAPHLGEDSAR